MLTKPFDYAAEFAVRQARRRARAAHKPIVARTIAGSKSTPSEIRSMASEVSLRF
jgi:hypothetical protein